MDKTAKITVNAWQLDGILLEQYSYTKGLVAPLPKHSHPEYQLGINLDRHGEYYYRGVHHYVPPKHLSVVQAGEAHLPNQRTEILTPIRCLMMEIQPAVLYAVASEQTEKQICSLAFPKLVIIDAELVRLFLRLHQTTRVKCCKLEQDWAVFHFLAQLFSRHSETTSLPPVQALPHSQIQQAREFLDAHYAENISLEQVAAIAGLSRFHFCRAFHRVVGVSPYVYQRQRRIDQAKRLLSKGMPLHQVALDVGFADQSHFGLHFKRLVGITPGQYIQKRAIIF
ncbi:AraC family transcriptional regulator [Gloeocapsa sp. BRSZ]